ncbi:sensor histidine kinase [Xylophilus sp.]|uniref:sensor histidine kinase n=1 Tax=Xylophilus sp. TaxID=2653893 RepID=UPI0013B9E4E6|nr:sensor histidine kinase [Xylophilus sp.]KAF1043944.1 MAG: Sensor protein QseC [Xylophilus sp.]
MAVAPPAEGVRVSAGLRNRLLVLLIVPLVLLALVNAWLEYRSADDAALQHDRSLLRMIPLLADSVLAPGHEPLEPPIVLLLPPLEDFLRQHPDLSGWRILDVHGQPLLGTEGLDVAVPATREAEFFSVEQGGITFRVAAQRVDTNAGELIVAVGDGSDARQAWLQQVLLRVLLRVLLPNLVLVAAAALAIDWAVRLAFRPLMDLTEAVERRSPRDLSAIDEAASPQEVRPLVHSLNRLFGLVNAQAEGQRRFVADAAHQLRTPLAGLQAQVEAWALAVPAGSDGAWLPREQLFKLRRAARRTSQLAHQLLTLSRAHPLQPVDLKALCESALEQFLDAATARRIDLGLDVRPAVVGGHEWLLRELLANLVDNAVRYTPEGGTVTIRCGLRNGRVFLEVEDDGPGIPPAERARVTQRFYRVRGTVGEGSGLGLAIADEIARVHGSALALGAGAHGRGLVVTAAF